MKGNLPIHCVCFVCGEDVDYHAEPGLFGYRCCWCQRATHTECFARIGAAGVDETRCDFGMYRDMIIPPANVQAVAARGRRKIRLTAPVGVDNWSPLFVIGNYDDGLGTGGVHVKIEKNNNQTIIVLQPITSPATAAQPR